MKALSADLTSEMDIYELVGPSTTYLEMLSLVDVTHVTQSQVLIGILSCFHSLDNSKDFSTKLLSELGCINLVLGASRERIFNIASISNEAWLMLQAVRRMVTVVFKEPFEDKPVLSNTSEVLKYLQFTMTQNKTEQVRVLYLDTRNRVLRDECNSLGTVNSTAFYPRELISRIVELRASAIVLAHNHPSGDPSPSGEDLEMTKRLQRVLHDIDVQFHDHIIVGQYRTFSFRREGLMR